MTKDTAVEKTKEVGKMRAGQIKDAVLHGENHWSEYLS